MPFDGTQREEPPLVDKIKAKYPMPVTLSDGCCMDNAYCVLGAFSMYLLPKSHDRYCSFPAPWLVGATLCEYNPNLSHTGATILAEDIARKNDSGNFDAAWAKLREALDYKR